MALSVLRRVAALRGRLGSAVGTPSCAANFRSDHPGGANFLFADSSVHFLTEDINMLIYQQLSTMKGEEVVDLPPE